VVNGLQARRSPETPFDFGYVQTFAQVRLHPTQMKVPHRFRPVGADRMEDVTARL